MAWLRAALMLVAAGVIAISVAPLGARAWWVLDLFTHFRIQYLAIGIVLLLLLAAVRKPAWCAALGACIAINAAAASDYWPALRQPSNAALETREPIRVLTVNLSTLDFTPEPLLEIIGGESPDIVLLVEFTPVWQERLQKLDAAYPHRLKLPARGAFGLALLSRHELVDARQIALGANAAIEARIRAPAGSFTLLGVHLRAPMNRALAILRNGQLEELAERRAAISGPVMVLGDFNITPFSPFFIDWLAATGLRDAGAGRGPWFSWPSSLPIAGIPIDHCVVSEDFEVTAHRRLPAFGSDHYPVLAEVVLR